MGTTMTVDPIGGLITPSYLLRDNMCTNPGWHLWWMDEDFLEGGMRQLEKGGVDMVTVKIVPSKSQERYYLVIYRTPDDHPGISIK